MGQLDDAVAAAHARGREAWPGVEVSAARFAARVAAVTDDAELVVRLAAPDLYLAIACADGDARGLAAFERELTAASRPTLARMGLSPTAIDETLQVMREELLVSATGAARILNYSGRGALRGWLRSVAARTGLRVLGPKRPTSELDDAVHAAAGDDLELEFLKKTYGAAFQTAFRAALAELPAKERLLLKQRLRHKLTVEELGVQYGVNASTVSRWVTAAREALVAATKKGMMRALHVDKADVSSILRLIDSEVDITLTTMVDA